MSYDPPYKINIHDLRPALDQLRIDVDPHLLIVDMRHRQVVITHSPLDIYGDTQFDSGREITETVVVPIVWPEESASEG